MSNPEVTKMHSGTQERRRKFYGWGYEGDEVSPQEIAEFEKAWTRLLGVSDFTAVPFPSEDSINLRPCRVKVPASLEALCTTDKYDRLYHTYGASSVDVAHSVAANSKIPPTRSLIRAPKTKSSSYSAGANTIAWQPYRTAAGRVSSEE
jgi:alkyldihydroxyacetonephosphate synthase